MAKESEALRAYAIARHKAYVMKDRLDQRRAQAIAKILKVADHFRDAKATGWIHQIKSEILAILPSEEGRFSKQRAEILELIRKA